MHNGTPSRSPLDAGILSALLCLWARELADTRQSCQVVMLEVSNALGTVSV